MAHFNNLVTSICSNVKGSPGAAVKLLPCDHEVMGSSSGNNLLQKCRERLLPKVVRPCVSGSYVHRAALLSALLWGNFMEFGKSFEANVPLVDIK
jgi:hypothetical protein